jgi:hypothetical protein
LALFCALLIAALGVGRASAQEAPKQWLFVLQGTLTSISDKTMSLRPDPGIVAFTDRPNRIARVIGVAALVADFSEGDGDGFNNDPPNASLVSEADGEIGVIEIITFSGDEAGVEMTFSLLGGGLPAVGDRIAITIDKLTSANQDPPS